jgi:hypothetical protein
MSRRKQTVVRMLAQVVHIIYGSTGTDMSGNEPDKSELAVRKLLKMLQQLADRDPCNKFGTYFVRLQLKLLKRLRNSRH